jgi:hypothetical protein
MRSQQHCQRAGFEGGIERKSAPPPTKANLPHPGKPHQEAEVEGASRRVELAWHLLSQQWVLQVLLLSASRPPQPRLNPVQLGQQKLQTWIAGTCLGEGVYLLVLALQGAPPD